MNDPCIISIQYNKSLKELKAIIRTPKNDHFISIDPGTPKSKFISLIKEIYPELSKINSREIKSAGTVHDLVHMEERFVSEDVKLGIVYCKSGQVNENDMFSNETGSSSFETFLDLMGDRVRLKGFKEFRGELDAELDTTGTHSVFTKFEGFNIMFHVSTLLPHSKVNNQQVERKSRIGNDVCIILFQDSTDTAFSPLAITSKFNHVFLVVQQINDHQYRLGVASKKGVRSFGPLIEKDGLYDISKKFREILLTKLINGERASYFAPAFNQARTRKEWMKNIMSTFK